MIRRSLLPDTLVKWFPMKSGEFHKYLEYKYFDKITFLIVKKKGTQYLISVLSNEPFTLSHTERNIKGGIIAHVSHHYKKDYLKGTQYLFDSMFLKPI
jgi:hypothetical protein